MPDFKKIDKIIVHNNSKIVIGTFGYINIIKGLYILENVINYYSLNNNITIVVFGKCSINNFKNQYIYNNIEELNELLIKHKPNIFLELSIWPETYSYTLSLQMLINLPIIYFKKTGNFVIEERLSHYKKSHCFKNINEIEKIAYNNKQNWFYTIKPIIFFNSFWDEYFII